MQHAHDGAAPSPENGRHHHRFSRPPPDPPLPTHTRAAWQARPTAPWLRTPQKSEADARSGGTGMDVLLQRHDSVRSCIEVTNKSRKALMVVCIVLDGPHQAHTLQVRVRRGPASPELTSRSRSGWGNCTTSRVVSWLGTVATLFHASTYPFQCTSARTVRTVSSGRLTSTAAQVRRSSVTVVVVLETPNACMSVSQTTDHIEPERPTFDPGSEARTPRTLAAGPGLEAERAAHVRW
ncbi:hypothetical protein C8Q76DRAFT_464491 [Earliella scabrosa]|nr:hypothetical protein C8Q76DRAFT_464491 [Earliella scabrosa]